MVNFSGTHIKTQTAAHKFVSGAFFGGRVRQTNDVIAIPATALINDTCSLVSLPSKARLLPQSIVYFPAFAASTTIDFGDENDPDGLMSAVSVAAAGSSTALEAMTADNYCKRLWEMLGYATDPQKDLALYFTLKGANQAAAKYLSVQLLYTDE